MLTQKEVVKKVMGAFLPFRCAVQIGDYGSKLRAKIFNHQRVRFVEISKLPLCHMQDERKLGFALEQVRTRLQNEGYVFR
jgi:hypothetical protein